MGSCLCLIFLSSYCRKGVELLTSRWAKAFFEGFEAFDAYNGNAGVLEGLGEAEKHHPQHAFDTHAYGQQHLREAQQVAHRAKAEKPKACAVAQ